jgi:hypothetical protein
VKRRGLIGPNFHALRHSHASHLLKAGVDLKEGQMRLGHSKASFTLSTYVHLLPGADQEAARRVDIVLRKAIEQTRQSKVMRASTASFWCQLGANSPFPAQPAGRSHSRESP